MKAIFSEILPMWVACYQIWYKYTRPLSNMVTGFQICLSSYYGGHLPYNVRRYKSIRFAISLYVCKCVWTCVHMCACVWTCVVCTCVRRGKKRKENGEIWISKKSQIWQGFLGGKFVWRPNVVSILGPEWLSRVFRSKERWKERKFEISTDCISLL